MMDLTPDAVKISREIWPIKRSGGKSGKKRDVMTRLIPMLCFDLGDCWYFRGNHCRLGYGRFPALGEVRAHRVSWRLFKGEIPTGMMVLHKCDVRCCVNPDHLFLGTQTDNMRDMVAKGRGVVIPQHGEKNPMARLTAAKVIEIKEFRRSGLSFAKIGDLFGVTASTVRRAVIGTSWSKI